MHPEPFNLAFPTPKRLPPLESLVALKSLIAAIPPATSQRLTARRTAVRALAFDKLALTNANADTIVSAFPFNTKNDRYSLLHAIVSSTPPPTLPGLDPDYAHEHLLDQHLLIVYLLILSLICDNPASDTDTDIVSAKHPVLDHYCSATLLPTHYIHQALACVYLDLGLIEHFDAAFPYARMQDNPVLFEYIVWVLAFDSGFLKADGSLISSFTLPAFRQNGSGDQEDQIACARNILILCYSRGELPPELAMSVCLTWNVNDAVKAAIKDPANIIPLLSYMSIHYSPGSNDTRHHLSLLTNNAHFLLAPKNGTTVRNDLISWSLCHVLAPPDNGLAHVPNLVFHLFAHAIDYPRAIYTHYRIKQIKKNNNVAESPADVDRGIKVKTELVVRMQVTHAAELKMFVAQGVPGERAWLAQQGLADLLYTNTNAGASGTGMVGLQLAAGIKRAAPVAEWAKATTLELDAYKKPVPVRESSSNASDATVAMPEALLFGSSMETGDLIRNAPFESPERPVKKARKAAAASPVRGSMQDEEEEQQKEAEVQEGDGMDVDVGHDSFVYSDQVMELQTSQSPIRRRSSISRRISFGAPRSPVASTPIRAAPTAATFTPTPAASTSTPGGLTASQVSTPASTSSSLVRDPFTPTFALPRTPSTTNHPSTTPPSVATGSILHLTPNRDGTQRTPTYLSMTPVDAAKAIMSRRSRRSNPASAAAVQHQAPSRPGSPGAQTPARSSRASAPSTSRTVTPFKSRLSNTASARADDVSGTRPPMTADDVIMATFADNQEHQEMIAPVSAAAQDASTGEWDKVPASPTTDMAVDRPTTPEPAPAPTSAPATPFDSDPTIRPLAHLPKFDYAQFHKSHEHDSPAADTDALIESGMTAVQRAKDMVRKSQAAADARAARHAVPETPVASRGAASAAATPSTGGSDSITVTLPVRPGRMPDAQSAGPHPAAVADTPENTRRVRNAGHTPAPARLTRGSTARTPYDTQQQTPSRLTRSTVAAAAVAAASPRYELRNKPAPAAPVSPAPTRRTTAAAGKRTASASQVDAAALVSPAKTSRHAAAAAGAETTPKRVPARVTRAGLRSASLGVDAADEAQGSPVRPAAAAAASGKATRRATMGGAGAAGAAGAGAAGSRRATMGPQKQQQQQPESGVAARPKRAAAAGKKK